MSLCQYGLAACDLLSMCAKLSSPTNFVLSQHQVHYPASRWSVGWWGMGWDENKHARAAS